jgi:hypothetical protein
MQKLYKIIQNNRMSTRPEYYSGRGATISDLDCNILEGIYKGIETDYGKDAAENFVKMVDDIKVLSATIFLEELYQLFRNNWKYKAKKTHASGITVPKDENGEYDMMAGMFGMMAALTSSGRDDTQRIKGSFLRSHGVAPKKGKVDMYGDYECYY